jgi:hypothetical protein
MSDEILTYIKDTVTRIETKQDNHDVRIGNVERWQSNADGKITMIAAIGAAIGGGIVAVVDYFRH